MALLRFDPFRDLDRLADQALSGARAVTMRAIPMAALRRGCKFLVALDVPGLTPTDVDVTVEQNVIDITARRPVMRQEGDLDASKLTAEFDRGVSTLTIAVSEASTPTVNA
jgi:HSP20 family protein